MLMALAACVAVGIRLAEHWGAGAAWARLLPSPTSMVGQCRLTGSKSVLKAPMVSALESTV